MIKGLRNGLLIVFPFWLLVGLALYAQEKPGATPPPIPQPNQPSNPYTLLGQCNAEVDRIYHDNIDLKRQIVAMQEKIETLETSPGKKKEKPR